MGRPPLKRNDPTVKTTLRFTTSLLARIRAVAGEREVADFIRDAAEKEVVRAERRKQRGGADD